MKLLAYNNDPKLRRDFIREMRKHQKMDQIIKGTYGQGDNGDFICQQYDIPEDKIERCPVCGEELIFGDCPKKCGKDKAEEGSVACED